MGLRDTPLDDLLMLVVGERRAFPGGPDRNKTVRALIDLPDHQGTERFLVHCSVLEWRDQCGK